MTTVNATDCFINTKCFYNCRNITSIDLSYQPWVNNSMSGAFTYCNGLTFVNNINNNVTDMQYTFSSCINLINVPVIPNSVTDMSGTFSSCTKLNCTPIIPNSVTNMGYTFYTTSIINAPVIPNSVTNMGYTFYSCSNLRGDICIQSNIISTASNCFANCDTYNKYVWIKPNTTTWNTFISAGYDTNGTQNKVFMREWDGTFSNLTVNVTPNTANVNIIDMNEAQVTRIFNVNVYSHANVYACSFNVGNVNYMSNYNSSSSTFTVSLPDGNYNVITDLTYTGGYIVETLNVSNGSMYMNCDGYSNNPITVVNGTQLVAGGSSN